MDEPSIDFETKDLPEDIQNKIEKLFYLSEKKYSEKLQAWMDNLPATINCPLCGLPMNKKRMVVLLEDSPRFIIYGEVAKTERFVILACQFCKRVVETEGLDKWGEREIMIHQKDFICKILKKMVVDNMSRKDALKFIIEEYRAYVSKLGETKEGLPKVQGEGTIPSQQG